MRNIKLRMTDVLDRDYLNKLEKLIRLKLTTKEALVNWFGFTEADFDRIKSIEEREIRKIVSGINRSYLINRKNIFADFAFT